ncbi:hypothetical protein [Pseudofrankia inefficax]|uniref:Secreted protein n=1 Tax=Pseudofrankia inefficax (strain DSM 45817 / CECT 9037 / DDB 130130 / EuI1c) TaxID=298654 RepID=E3J8N0_PSEI1|nr:hypothetical protein [Pseudofrankia inefficax]ADP78473.1 hypothetical protein FraEuI1c_0387 [Pseudofrankia inefficax]
MSSAMKRLCRRARVAVFASAVVASVSAGMAAATPASAAVSAPRMLSALVACQSGANPGVVTLSATQQDADATSGAAHHPCWNNGS